MVSLSPSPLATSMAGRASASPSWVQTWQASQNTAAIPIEGVEGEVMDTMEQAQSIQPMLGPPMPLLPGRCRCRLWRAPLSMLDG